METKQKPVLGIIIASTRPGRAGKAIGDWVVAKAEADGRFDVRILDLKEIDLPFLDEPQHPAKQQYQHEHTKKWSAAVAECDAFVLVMPEYNFFASAPLINALDFLKAEWKYKTVGFVSYGGVSRGLRAVEAIKPLLVSHQMFAVGAAIALMLSEDIGEKGQPQETEVITKSVAALFDDLVKVDAAMRTLR